MWLMTDTNLNWNHPGLAHPIQWAFFQHLVEDFKTRSRNRSIREIDIHRLKGIKGVGSKMDYKSLFIKKVQSFMRLFS